MRNVTILCVAAALSAGGLAMVGCDRGEENTSRAPSNTTSAENTPDNVARRDAQLAAERRNEAAESTGTTPGVAGAPSSTAPTTRPSRSPQ